MKHWTSFHAVVTLFGIGLGIGVITLSCGGGGAGPADSGLSTGLHPIIVIAVDGLRADSLGAFGGDIGTPNFDALASQAAHFQWAFAQAAEPSVTFAAMLTGLYPTTSGVVKSGDRLPEEAVTMAEVLAGAGVTTAAFVEGAAGGDDFGLAQGFSEFHSSDRPGMAATSWIANHANDTFLVVFRGWSVGLHFGPGAGVDGATPPEGFYERLQTVLASGFGDQPEALEPEDLAYVRELYTSRVRNADAALGELTTRLEELGLAERATLVVTGLNGLDLQQHGPSGSVSLHSTVTRVPLLIRLPNHEGAGLSGKIVELIDVMPTLLDLAGVESPTATQGASLVPVIEGTGKPPYIAFSETPHLGGQRAVALGGMRLIDSAADGSAVLFDLAADPGELEDRAVDSPDRVEVLQRHLDAWSKMVSVSSLDPERRTEEELDDETLDRLKSLGYIQ